MAEYHWDSGSDSETLYREGKRVGGISRGENADEVCWWYTDTCGYPHFGFRDMPKTELLAKVVLAYED